MHDLGKKMAAGAGWMVAMRLADRALGLVSTIILARLLVPADFGLVALATTLLAVLEVLGTFSFDLALIQNQTAERRHYDTAWTITVIYGALTALVLIATAPLASAFFNEPRLLAVILVFAACPLTEGFSNIGVVAFRKELDFRREFKLLFLKRAIGFVITIALAFSLRTYWALVIGSLATKLAGVAISYALHPFRPRLSLSAHRDLFRFSSWLLLNNIVVFAAIRGYDVIIGRLSGTQALGFYSVAYEIANLPTTELVHPLSRAAFPGFSHLASDRAKLRQAYLAIASLAALVTIPLGTGVSVVAEPVVRLLLGDKWLDAVPLIQTLALYGVLRASQAGTGDAYLALGATRVIALVNLPHLLVGWPVMVLLVQRYGLQGAPWAVLCASVVVVSLNFTLAVRLLDVHVRELADCFWRPTIGALTTYGVVWGTMDAWPPVARTGPLILQTTAYVAVGALTYIGVVSVLWFAAGRPDGGERILLRWCSSQIAGRTVDKT